MRRRWFLALMASTSPLAGCTGGPGDPITMLAVNQDGSSHSVTVWAVQGEELTVSNTVEVAGNDVTEVGQMPWKSGQYRVTVQVDGDVVVARQFASAEWFNQLDVTIDGDGTVELNRGRAA